MNASEKLTMPKNVQAFLNKYGSIGSKEQDATFWKEFRKAANAYADVQVERICNLENALATVTEQRDAVTLRLGKTQERMIDAERQRDRLAEALLSIKNELGVPQPEYPAPVANAVKIANEALQSLTPKAEP
jgi:hypothetical protein